jgi:hypothetical protein
VKKDRASHVSRGTPFSFPTGLNVDLYDIARFFSKVSVGRQDRCWEWKGAFVTDGYGTFHVLGKHYLAHRFSYMLANQEIDSDVIVRHKCDNRWCVNPYHLESGTHADNMSDRTMRGRTPKGSRNGNAKLTEEDVRKIRLDNRPNPRIAADFGVSTDTVSHVKRRKSWGHVKD